MSYVLSLCIFLRLSPCLTETNNKNNRPTTPPFWACQLQAEATAWRSLATLVISCGIKDHNAFRVLAPALDDSPALASTKLSMLSDCLMSITEGPISSLVETLLRLLEVCHAFSFSTHSNIERATASVVRSLLVSNHSNTQEFVQGMQVLSRFIRTISVVRWHFMPGARSSPTAQTSRASR